MKIRTGRLAGMAFCIGILSCTTAMAQVSETVDATTSAYRQVHLSCAADTVRFCPAINHATAMPRDQVMCLKIYRVDLTLGCRNALAAVKAATETEP
jgi:hypothetical protein